MTHLPPRDPQALASFPAYEPEIETTWYRAHQKDRPVLLFSNTGSGRFDPPPEDRNAYGTCYLAATEAGAFLEKFARLGPYLNEEIVWAADVTEVAVTSHLRLADLTEPSVIGRFFVDNDLSCNRDYVLSQAWGASFRLAGFDGVRFHSRHDPSGRTTSLAIFGSAGFETCRAESGLDPRKPIAMEYLIDEMALSYGIAVLPTVHL